MERQHAGNLFHQQEVGFGAVLIKEGHVNFRMHKGGRFLAGDAVDAFLVAFAELEVRPLGHGVHHNVHIAGGKFLTLGIVPAYADLEVLAHAVGGQHHEEFVAVGQLAARRGNGVFNAAFHKSIIKMMYRRALEYQCRM